MQKVGKSPAQNLAPEEASGMLSPVFLEAQLGLKEVLSPIPIEAKQELLGVNEHTLIKHGAVSAATVEEMAVGAAKQANAEVAIAISGVAGPGGGTPDKPVGTVWFGFFINGKHVSQKQHISGDRQAVRIKAIEFALSHTLKLLLN